MTRTRTRKRGYVLAVGAALSAVLLAACDTAESTGGAPSGEAPSVERGESAELVPAEYASNKLVVALDGTYPPVTYLEEDGKTMSGVKTDIMRAVLDTLGLKFEIVPATFDSIIPGIDSGKYDMSSFNDTAEREQVLDFVNIYESGTVLLVTAGNPEGLTLETLCGVAVAVQKGSEQESDIVPQLSEDCVAAGEDELDPMVYTSQNDAALALDSGRAGALLMEEVGGEYAAQQSNGRFEVPDGAVMTPHLVGVALPKGSNLVKPIAAAFDEIVADGTYEEILRAWEMDSIAIDKAVVNAEH